MSKQLLDNLNPEQKQAVVKNDGPLLILAGAGSGKTRVLTHKFAYLAGKNSPESILAMTFTNKAAKEMKERIESLIRKDLKGTWVGTFHSQCNRILRKEIATVGYKNDFSIYDNDDQCTLIRHILKEFKIYEAMYKGILSRISSLKSSSISPEEFITNGEGYGFDEKLARVYVRYQDELKRCNALDYDDLIMLCIRLFEENPDKLKKYQALFKHILVDEFQDTNQAQYKLLRLLADEHRNICVVGDDDQSIYAFRGANIQNILSFEKDYPDTKVIKLERNYRSTENILHVSDCIIKNNSQRREKSLKSERGAGEQVCHCWFPTEKEEAAYISKLIKEFYLKGIYDYKDFAVLYRINLQSRSIEEALRRERLPYRVIGGISFYQRKEIKDIAAYMKLAINPDDNVSLRRIINVPARGIGATTLSKIEQYSKKNNKSLMASIKALIKGKGVTASIKEKLSKFVKIADKLSALADGKADSLVEGILTLSGYSEQIEEARLENVQEFIRSAAGRDIMEFMDTLSLVSKSDDQDEDNRITLLTLHSAKGLEFPVVFIAGIEEGVIPYFKATTPAELDEERRLLYVGMTRAKNNLWLTGAGKRRLYSKTQDQEPSRFLAHLPENSCKRIDKIVQKLPDPSRRPKIKPVKVLARPKALYSIGAKVKHPKWGVGTVRDYQGQGTEQKITVNFPTIGVKRLAIKFANLERIT